jgi:hypothetical protein
MKGLEPMTLIEILKAKGISDDIIQAVQDDMKANKIFTSAEENIDIRYGKLKTQHDAVVKERDEANALIETLQKSNKGNEGLQQQVNEYKANMEKLQAELMKAKINAAAQVGLLSAGCKPEDIDYIMFRLQSEGELELDEHENIKGWEDKVAGAKTRFPAHFTSSGGKTYEEHRLPDDKQDPTDTITKEQFNKMGYNSRVELKKNNPEQYSQLMKG